ncbi:hypothetical protein [Ruminococcus sp.]|uniref:hypothetical protein n=1 Tax=Ruminococcus sp. TaxID=41978 RepID=UPI0025DECD1E|nr:hypothetical protein [Ruminococcus sp.]
MRTIREVFGNDEKVWVYLNNENAWKQFVNMAVAEGFHFGNLPVERWTFGYVIAVHSNGNIGHLPLFVWCRSFSLNDRKCPKKIDFMRYISNEDDYCCKNSHFTGKVKCRP